MAANITNDFPFQIKLSFSKIFDQIEARYNIEDKKHIKEYLSALLHLADQYPELKTGINYKDALKKYKEPVDVLLDDLFPNILQKNEIKAACIPFVNAIFKSSDRFKKIMEKEEDGFQFDFQNISVDEAYIQACALILNDYYGYAIDFNRPLYYENKDESGVIRTYRIFINADLADFHPTDQAREISKEDVDELLQDPNNVEKWKTFFPPHSWEIKGFTLLNLTDVTKDEHRNHLKNLLINSNLGRDQQLNDQMTSIMQKIFGLPDLKFGFTIYDDEDGQFKSMDLKQVKSYILGDMLNSDCDSAVCQGTMNALVQNEEYFAIPDVDKYQENSGGNKLCDNLKKNDIRSCLLAPIAKKGKLLGVLELVSPNKNELNGLNARKIDDILPFIYTAAERNLSDYQNYVKAVIQSECTAIHPSVTWRFEEEAIQFIQDQNQGKIGQFDDIVFEDVHPLFGQIDIVSSTKMRNEAIQQDFRLQLKDLQELLQQINQRQNSPIIEHYLFQIESYLEQLSGRLTRKLETQVSDFVRDEINALLIDQLHNNTSFADSIKAYQSTIDFSTGLRYQAQQDFTDAVQYINEQVACYIDEKQKQAQQMFPHYYERFKTDGVEHTMYVGQSITKSKKFTSLSLKNLRIWQLQTMCEMERYFYEKQKELPVDLKAASLILVFNQTLSIRYRMDEKQFDVDGAYNASYEVIKKRIDKAFIKNKNERLTQAGKIAIVYTQKQDKREYLKYIEYLQKKGLLQEEVESLELEELQGVSGLFALRVKVDYDVKKSTSQKQLVHKESKGE